MGHFGQIMMFVETSNLRDFAFYHDNYTNIITEKKMKLLRGLG